MTGDGWPPLDMGILGEITAGMLVETFPEWRVLESRGAWWAVRGGKQEKNGPRSLLALVIDAPDPTALAEKLCLQEWLDGLSPDELEAVWRDVALPRGHSGLGDEDPR